MPKKAPGTTTRRKTAAKKKKTTAKKRTVKKTAPSKVVRPEAEATRSTAEKLRVRQVRSGIGRAETYRRTLRALGLKHYQDEVVVADNPSMRGMLHKVRHLVRVSPEEA
ncbi:MAG: 50S ribosomal protein L30 [Gemmatimonadales bacterium]|nr:50S ribosomal protein L30 [Gemmatimonadales bacterium]NIN12781.1 50S ribosomal protein L30 [Gemmatimonadales bacterium]NIN51005.1 50S ribosomal protein L30 [Gemmatimonadales bacterium]NIP08469.1 50S ribosomal protein L30 [Gemmatimonadales bacterium]NIR02189.1 50S ribosomal protein L30 [Gemmatimonadales bacterium]